MKFSFLEISMEDVGISIYCASIGPGGAETALSPWTGIGRFGQVKTRIFFLDSRHCVGSLKIIGFLSTMKFETFGGVLWFVFF